MMMYFKKRLRDEIMLETSVEKEGLLEEGVIDKKFGDISEGILEFLGEKGKASVDELMKKIPLVNITILDFMNEWEFIELKNHEVRIAKFGLDLLNIE
jgi:hypothetical protein